MFNKSLLVLISILLMSPVAWSAVEMTETSDGKLWGGSSRTKTAADGLSLREIRKVGFGFKTAGIAGLFGLVIELNFSPEISFSSGWGVGDGYQTLHVN